MTDCACGCQGACGCGTASAPPAIADPLKFRHSAILSRMKASLASTRVGGAAPLAGWTTREASDPGIALLDAQAVALHVLGWNIHRLWADGTLPGSEDPAAMGALARLLGHVPRPALSASTVLSLHLDDLSTAPEQVEVPQGLKVASVPGKNELPQTFETDAPLTARKAWNRLPLQRRRAHREINTATATLTLQGAAPLARAGDLVLVWASATQWLAARIVQVDRPVPAERSAEATTVLTLASQALVLCPAEFGDTTYAYQVILLGDRASAFGSTAADPSLFSTTLPAQIEQMEGDKRRIEWKDLVMTATGTHTGGTLDLDAVHDAAMAGKAVLFAALDASVAAQMGKITAVQEGARRGFGLSSKVSRVTVSGVNLDPTAPTSFARRVRETAIYIETARERLALLPVDAQVPDPATRDRIVVTGEHALEPGRRLILQGTDWVTGAATGQAVTLARAEPGAGGTTLVLTEATAATYHAEGLVIYGNCVSASHGETPISGAEGLGTGQPGAERPRFRLKSGPVAHVPADTARGYAPALVVRVGGREYTRADSLLDAPPEARIYRFAADTPVGPLVEFVGPLPAGQAITAALRKGGGPQGNVAAGRLTTVTTPIPGVRGATNPFAASGGMAAETPDDLRRGLPASVRTLGRAVALEDFQAFALEYRGVGKALATELRHGMRRVLCLTIADTSGASPIPGAGLAEGLRDAILAACPPGLSVRVEGFDALTATVHLAFAHDPALDRCTVEASLRAALLAAFAPAVRPFGQALHRAQILAAAHAVPGVLAAHLTAFSLPTGPPEAQGRLLCPLPRFEQQPAPAPPAFRRAGLIALAGAALTLAEITP